MGNTDSAIISAIVFTALPGACAILFLFMAILSFLRRMKNGSAEIKTYPLSNLQTTEVNLQQQQPVNEVDNQFENRGQILNNTIVLIK